MGFVWDHAKLAFQAQMRVAMDVAPTDQNVFDDGIAFAGDFRQ